MVDTTGNTSGATLESGAFDYPQFDSRHNPVQSTKKAGGGAGDSQLGSAFESLRVGQQDRLPSANLRDQEL